MAKVTLEIEDRESIPGFVTISITMSADKGVLDTISPAVLLAKALKSAAEGYAKSNGGHAIPIEDLKDDEE